MKPAGLHQRAWELARYFNFPVACDAHYLALAEMADCPFWTADKRLFNTISGMLDWIQWLGNYQPEH
jgi:predicted nucleic acid-binding protein